MATYEERLSEFNTNAPPPQGLPVQILCADHVGTNTPPFPCIWNGGGWINAETGALLIAEVLGWRQPAGRLERTRTGAFRRPAAKDAE